MSTTRQIPFQLCVLVLLLASLNFGQATQPAMNNASMWRGFSIDFPADWVRCPEPVDPGAFSARAGAIVTAALHRQGSRPTDPPYAAIEHLFYPGGTLKPTTAQQRDLARQVADYYASGFFPPSKTARPVAPKKASVTPIDFDAANGTFRFSVVATYDRPPDMHIEVSGAFGPRMYVVSAIWADDPYYAANRASLIAMRDSLRSQTPANPTQKAEAKLRWGMQIVAGVVVVALVALQAWVLVRARRLRKAEAARVLSLIEPR